jgi:hypothetical protein
LWARILVRQDWPGKIKVSLAGPARVKLRPVIQPAFGCWRIRRVATLFVSARHLILHDRSEAWPDFPEWTSSILIRN